MTNWSWRRNATTSLGPETRRKAGPVPPLLGYGVLRFLDWHLPMLLYPRMPFFPSINQHPSPDPFFVLRQLVHAPFQIPSTPIHHQLLLFNCPIPVRCPVLLCYYLHLPYTKNERNGGQGERAVLPERRIELVDMTSRYSFSDGKSPTRNGSYVRGIFHVLKSTPPNRRSWQHFLRKC